MWIVLQKHTEKPRKASIFLKQPTKEGIWRFKDSLKVGLWWNNIRCRKGKVNSLPILIVNWELAKKIVVNWELGTPISTLDFNSENFSTSWPLFNLPRVTNSFNLAKFKAKSTSVGCCIITWSRISGLRPRTKRSSHSFLGKFRVRSFGMIRIRISYPRSLRSW